MQCRSNSTSYYSNIQIIAVKNAKKRSKSNIIRQCIIQSQFKVHQTVAPIYSYLRLTTLNDRCSIELNIPGASSRVPGKAECGAHLSPNSCTNHTILLYHHMRIYMAVLHKYNGNYTEFIEPIIKRPMLHLAAIHSTATAYLGQILMGSKTRGRIWTRVWRTLP